MIVGIGTDLMARSRLDGMAPDDPFFRKSFSEAERRQILQRTDPLAHFASHFAAKEAVMKAVGLDLERIRWAEIEILNEPNGQPVVRLSGGALQEAAARQITTVHLSISWEAEYVQAFAVAEGELQEPDAMWL